MAQQKPRQRGDGGGGEPRGPSAAQLKQHNKDLDRIQATREARLKAEQATKRK